eukprot:6196816-Pleurochrysis_carterae.AAC.1
MGKLDVKYWAYWFWRARQLSAADTRPRLCSATQGLDQVASTAALIARALATPLIEAFESRCRVLRICPRL